MSVFGWCLTSHHQECTVEHERFFIETKKGKSVIVWTGDTARCDCTCHRKRDK